MRSAKPVASPPLPSVMNEPSCSTSTCFTPTLVSALGHAVSARPGLGLIQRGGDFAVTCYVAVKALTSSSAAVAADCRDDGHDAGRRHRMGRPTANYCALNLGIGGTEDNYDHRLQPIRAQVHSRPRPEGDLLLH